jgi:hypothetical protein
MCISITRSSQSSNRFSAYDIIVYNRKDAGLWIFSRYAIWRDISICVGKALIKD